MAIRIEQLDLDALSRLFINKSKDSILEILTGDKGEGLTVEELDALGIKIQPDDLLNMIIDDFTTDQHNRLGRKITDHLDIDKFIDFLNRMTEEDIKKVGWKLREEQLAEIGELSNETKESLGIRGHEIVIDENTDRNSLIEALKELSDDEKNKLGINGISLEENIRPDEKEDYINTILNIYEIISDIIDKNNYNSEREEYRYKVLKKEILDILLKYSGKTHEEIAEMTDEQISEMVKDLISGLPDDEFNKFIKDISVILYEYKDILDNNQEILDLTKDRFEREVQLLNVLLKYNIYDGVEIKIPNPYESFSYPVVTALEYKYGAGMSSTGPAGGTNPKKLGIRYEYQDDDIFIILPSKYTNYIVKEIHTLSPTRFIITFKDNDTDNLMILIEDKK